MAAKKTILASVLNDQETREHVYRQLSVKPKQLFANFGVNAGRIASVIGGSAKELPSQAFNGIDEAIVVAQGRPAYTIQANTFLPLPTDTLWGPALTAVKPTLERRIRAIGRVELENHPTYQMLGTAWLVAPEVAVTNRHVAEIFAQQSGNRFVFRSNPWGETIAAAIDFREELAGSEEDEFTIEEIIDILPDDDGSPDMAFLRVSRRGAAQETLAEPIPLASGQAEERQKVVVIGYPAWDGERNPQFMDQIFGDIFEVKRLAPGKVMAVENGFLTHDCSTLGGNSGSAVIDLATGKAIGLHFGGRFLVENYAVPAQAIREHMNRLGINVGEAAQPAPGPLVQLGEFLVSSTAFRNAVQGLLDKHLTEYDLGIEARNLIDRYKDFAKLVKKTFATRTSEEPITATAIALWTAGGFASGVATRWLGRRESTVSSNGNGNGMLPMPAFVFLKVPTAFLDRVKSLKCPREVFNTVAADLLAAPQELKVHLSHVVSTPVGGSSLGISLEEPVSATILATAFLAGAITGARVFDGKI